MTPLFMSQGVILGAGRSTVGSWGSRLSQVFLGFICRALMPPNDRSLATSNDSQFDPAWGSGRGGLCGTGPWIWDFAGSLVGQRVTAGPPVHLSALVGPTHHLMPLPGWKGEMEILGRNRVSYVGPGSSMGSRGPTEGPYYAV